tara:strand:+ start:309 stop:2075 length:1767 start_codon:yes stop_codon:yes gene_type:complete
MKHVNHLSILGVFGFIYGQVQFTDVTDMSGMSYGIRGEGVCIFDYNNDGLEDVFICDNNTGSNVLFKNLGNMDFEEVSFAAGITTSSPTRLPLAADYNNDGCLDLFIGALSGNSFLYKNNCDGSFTDVTTQSGIVTDGGIRGGAWSDVNKDGFVDLYVGRLLENNYLFQNNGDGTFINVAQNMNASGPQSNGLVMGLSFVDYDNDGDDDIFITQDGNLGNILLRKEDAGMFIDISNSSNVNLPVMGMGVAVGDYNRDGYFDIYTSNLYENSLLKNSPEGIFNDVADSAGVGDIAGSMAWGTFFFDADNDGWLDIFNNNESGFGNVPNSFFLNQGNGTFADASVSAGLQSFNNGFGSAYGDLDNDGDLDIIAAGHPSSDGSILVYRNDSPTQNWVQFQLNGDGGLDNNSDRYAIGAKLILYTASGEQMSAVFAGNGYCSQNTLIQHFGLGSDAAIDSLIVYWPNITEKYVYDISQINQRYLLIRGAVEVFPLSVHSNTTPNNYRMMDIYPNPFNHSTTIAIHSDNQLETPYSINIYDALGRSVETLIDNRMITGKNNIQWNATSQTSGIYFIHLRTDFDYEIKKVLLLK